MGVSGGGGDPRSARVVEVDAVELIRFIPPDWGGLRVDGGRAEEGRELAR